MKKALLLGLIVISSFARAAEPPAPIVDQRAELLSIVFRLAGNPEYWGTP